ncbi:1-acyl-sn-glycerol-3-phosphate acyltransferase, partial [Planctomycetaceae bacterium AH-315-I19]|nr:1-acyl-sn-glycerol-3-phosphate acyltransferase [Planctomycetaceae bacterium AH-315-I19]
MSNNGTGRSPLFDRLLYWTGWTLFRVLLSLVWRTHYSGAESVPRTGGCLIVSNHQSHMDPPIVGTAIIFRPVHFIARLGLYKNAMFGWLITHVHTIPIREETGDLAAIKEALKRIEQGHAVVIFAEGTRSPDGTVQPFKRGVALLLKRSKCPVIPVAVEGAFDTMPRGRSLPKLRGRIACVYGKPIQHDELLADGVDAALTRLARDVENLRLKGRAELRQKTNGTFPPQCSADNKA